MKGKIGMQKTLLVAMFFSMTVMPIIISAPAMAQTAPADLSITMSASPDPVLSRRNLTYTIQVTNSGPDTAIRTLVADRVPNGTTFVSVSTTKGSCKDPNANGLVLCNLRRLLQNGSATVTLVVRVAAPGGTIRNVAAVKSDTLGEDKTNNRVLLKTQVTPLVADLSIDTSASPDPVMSGEILTYTINVLNNGPNDALKTKVIDFIPVGTTFNSVTTSQGSCSGGGAGLLVCNLGKIGKLASNNSATVTVAVNVTASMCAISNAAVVKSDTIDLDRANNKAASDTPITPTAGVQTVGDLAIKMSPQSESVPSGENQAYIISVANGGPDTANVVRVIDSIPDGTTLVSSDITKGGISQGSCTVLGTRTVRCNLGNLNALDHAFIKLVVKVTAPNDTTITNIARIVGNVCTADPRPLNNVAQKITPVTKASEVATPSTEFIDKVVDLEISNVPSNIPQTQDEIRHTITVENNGPDTADNVTVNIDFPDSTPVLSFNPSQGSCSSVGFKVTCNLGSLNNAGSANIEVEIGITANDLKNNFFSTPFSDGIDPTPVSLPVSSIAAVFSNTFNRNRDKNEALTFIKPDPEKTLPRINDPLCQDEDFGEYAKLLNKIGENSVSCNSQSSDILATFTQRQEAQWARISEIITVFEQLASRFISLIRD